MDQVHLLAVLIYFIKHFLAPAK